MTRRRGGLIAILAAVVLTVGTTMFMATGTSHAGEAIPKKLTVTNYGWYGLHVDMQYADSNEYIMGTGKGEAVTLNETDEYETVAVDGDQLIEIKFRAEAGKHEWVQMGLARDFPRDVCFRTDGTTIIGFKVTRIDC